MVRFLVSLVHWTSSLTLLVVGYLLTFMAHLSTPGLADIGVTLFTAGIAFNPLVLKLIPFRQYPTRLIVAFFVVAAVVVWAHWQRG